MSTEGIHQKTQALWLHWLQWRHWWW